MRIKAWSRWWTILRPVGPFCRLVGARHITYAFPVHGWRLRGLQARRRWAARNLGGGR